MTIDDTVAKAREILTWPDDWDGEGSPGYSEATLTRTLTFIKPILARGCPLPHIWAGPDGSVDVSWRGGRQLLINIPAERAEMVSWFGSDARSEVKGDTANDAAPAWLCAWLCDGGD